MRIDEPIDPECDLVLDRDIPVPPALVWQAWTRPEHLREWFTPRDRKSTRLNSSH